VVKANCPEAINEQEKINFAILRTHFFSAPNLKQIMESTIYAQLPTQFLQEIKQLGDITFVIYDVPLLFEKKLASKVDSSIVVYAPRNQQEERVGQRDGTDQQTIKHILDQQMDIEQKKSQADYVIDNSKDFKSLDKEYQQFITSFFTQN
jgi:dephospho-CoA kinase